MASLLCRSFRVRKLLLTAMSKRVGDGGGKGESEGNDGGRGKGEKKRGRPKSLSYAFSRGVYIIFSANVCTQSKYPSSSGGVDMTRLESRGAMKELSMACACEVKHVK